MIGFVYTNEVWAMSIWEPIGTRTIMEVRFDARNALELDEDYYNETANYLVKITTTLKQKMVAVKVGVLLKAR